MFYVLVLLAAQATAREINIAEHGVVPGKDASFALNRLIESISGESNITLVFPKGQYDFYPENAVEQYRAIANHDNGLKRLGFPLFDCQNITIDGGGSKFLFHGRMVPVTIERTSGATLRNFTIDWVRSFHAELTVIESGNPSEGFVVQTDPEKYPYQIAGNQILFDRYEQLDPIGSNIVFDPETNAPIHDTKKYFVNSKQAKVTAKGPGRFRIRNAGKHSPPVGSVLIVYGVHPTSRLCPAIHVINSSDIKIENVTVHDAGGMGLIVERTENISLDHMVVTSNQERIVATRADATHFIGCKGTIQLENCLFEHMLDDGVNVHGAYVKIVKYLGEKQFLCEISHFQQWGLTFAEAGDKITLLSRETILPFAKNAVTGIRPLNERRFIMTVEDDPGKLPEGLLSVENLSWYPDLIMRHNTIRQNRARSVLVTTKGEVLIENNYFSSQMNGILIEGDNKYWYESGAVEDVTIRNNEFVNSGFGGGTVYPLFASPMFTPDQRMGEGQYHRNIKFVNNKLKSFDGRMVYANSVNGLTISENKIELSADYPANSDYPSIDLNYCDQVTIENNTAEGFDRSLAINASKDTSGLNKNSNTGFQGTNKK